MKITKIGRSLAVAVVLSVGFISIGVSSAYEEPSTSSVTNCTSVNDVVSCSGTQSGLGNFVDTAQLISAAGPFSGTLLYEGTVIKADQSGTAAVGTTLYSSVAIDVNGEVIGSFAGGLLTPEGYQGGYVIGPDGTRLEDISYTAPNGSFGTISVSVWNGKVIYNVPSGGVIGESRVVRNFRTPSGPSGPAPDPFYCQNGEPYAPEEPYCPYDIYPTYFTIRAVPPTISVGQTETATYAITVEPYRGFVGPVSVTLDSWTPCPANATCKFRDPNTGVETATGGVLNVVWPSSKYLDFIVTAGANMDVRNYSFGFYGEGVNDYNQPISDYTVATLEVTTNPNAICDNTWRDIPGPYGQSYEFVNFSAVQNSSGVSVYSPYASFTYYYGDAGFEVNTCSFAAHSVGSPCKWSKNWSVKTQMGTNWSYGVYAHQDPYNPYVFEIFARLREYSTNIESTWQYLPGTPGSGIFFTDLGDISKPWGTPTSVIDKDGRPWEFKTTSFTGPYSQTYNRVQYKCGPSMTTSEILGKILKDDNGNGLYDLGEAYIRTSGIADLTNCTAANYYLDQVSINYSGPNGSSGSFKTNACSSSTFWPIYAVTLPAGNYTFTLNVPSGWEATGSGAPMPYWQVGGDGPLYPPMPCASNTSCSGVRLYAPPANEGFPNTLLMFSMRQIPNSPPSVPSVSVTEPDYCSSFGAFVNWTYSDPDGNPQSAYQVQIDDQGSFNNPEVDTGKISGSGTSYFAGSGLDFNITYKARVRVWDSHDTVSGWTESGSWKTPKHAYPYVDFTYSPSTDIPAKQSVQFTDQTTFYDSGAGTRTWSWVFGDGGTSAQQNQSHTYNLPGLYNASLAATDKDNYSCSRTKQINIAQPVPVWKEVSPR